MVSKWISWKAILLGGVMKDSGFYPRPSNALTRDDFSDPSKMYNTVSTPGGKPLQLCNKIDGLEAQDIRSLKVGNLPTEKDYVIESTPAFIKPGLDFGGTSFHWRVRISGGQYSIEAEIQNPTRFDGPMKVGKQERTDLARATGTSLSDVLVKLLGDNLVRCKKASTFSDHPEIRS